MSALLVVMPSERKHSTKLCFSLILFFEQQLQHIYKRQSVSTHWLATCRCSFCASCTAPFPTSRQLHAVARSPSAGSGRRQAPSSRTWMEFDPAIRSLSHTEHMRSDLSWMPLICTHALRSHSISIYYYIIFNYLQTFLVNKLLDTTITWVTFFWDNVIHFGNILTSFMPGNTRRLLVLKFCLYGSYLFLEIECNGRWYVKEYSGCGFESPSCH